MLVSVVPRASPLVHDTLGSISASHIPTSSPASTPLPQAALSACDYPNVRFWKRGDWEAHLKSKDVTCVDDKPTARGDNVTMLYVEDTDGNPVDGARATQIRRRAREIWNCFGKAGVAPATWRKLGLPQLRFYRHEITAEFAELQLCEGNWKTDRIATDNYPAWYRSYTKPDTKSVKLEKLDGGDTGIPSKRALSPQRPDLRAKKTKPSSIAVDLPLSGFEDLTDTPSPISSRLQSPFSFVPLTPTPVETKRDTTPSSADLTSSATISPAAAIPKLPTGPSVELSNLELLSTAAFLQHPFEDEVDNTSGRGDEIVLNAIQFTVASGFVSGATSASLVQLAPQSTSTATAMVSSTPSTSTEQIKEPKRGIIDPLCVNSPFSCANSSRTPVSAFLGQIFLGAQLWQLDHVLSKLISPQARELPPPHRRRNLSPYQALTV
jgi:hypothetical protein